MWHKIILTVLLIITRPSCHDVPNLGDAHAVLYSLSPVVCDVSSAVRHRSCLRKPGRVWRAKCRPTPEIVLLFLVFTLTLERTPHDGHGRLPQHGASATSGALLWWDTAVPEDVTLARCECHLRSLAPVRHRRAMRRCSSWTGSFPPGGPSGYCLGLFLFFLFEWAKPNVWSTEL